MTSEISFIIRDEEFKSRISVFIPLNTREIIIGYFVIHFNIQTDFSVTKYHRKQLLHELLFGKM